MAKSVNKVILVGRLGRDPEMKYTASGTPFCRFSMATDDSWTDKGSGERNERTEWHNIVVWDKLAEICNEFLTKGRLVYIEGSLQTREWDGQGQGGAQARNSGGESTFKRASGAGAAPPGDTITDDDIPF